MLTDNRLVRTFADLKAQDRKALLPFITAGYPSLDATAAMLREFSSRGVRVCELGIPFSDPVADGPVIQASYTAALESGVTVGRIFDMVKRFRASEAAGMSSAAIRNPKSEVRNSLSLLAMVSYSIVFRHGPEQFIRAAAAAGIDGLIVPDLPLDEADGFSDLAAGVGLCNVLLIAPTTQPQRQLDIARRSRGFIYYMSIAGVTGQRDSLPDATIAAVRELRRHTDTPICVGFGISNAATVRQVCTVADGAIVGSAIVSRITQAAKQNLPPEQIAAQAGQFVGELLAPLA